MDGDAQAAGVKVFKDMQGGFTKKSQELASAKKFAENINQAFENSGLNVGSSEQRQTLVNNYVAFDKLVATDPKRAIKQLMEHAKLTPNDFGTPAPTESSDDEYLTDTEKQFRSTQGTHEQKIQQLEQIIADDRSRAQQGVVDNFRNAKNEAGELLRPHFDLVKKDMMDLADLNPQLTIEQLYTKAVRMDDDLYNRTVETEKSRVVNQLETKRKLEVEKAKKLNRQSLQTGSINTTVVDQEALLEQAAIDAGFG